MNERRSRLERNLVWILLVILLLGCLMVMRPFISALLWAIVLSFSIWPLYRRLLNVLRGRRTLAAALMTLAIILVMLVPFVIVGATLAQNVNELSGALRHWLEAGPPAPPAWLAKVPVIGATAVEEWQTLATDSASLIEEAKRFIEPASAWFLKVGLMLGSGLFDLALSILI